MKDKRREEKTWHDWVVVSFIEHLDELENLPHILLLDWRALGSIELAAGFHFDSLAMEWVGEGRKGPFFFNPP